LARRCARLIGPFARNRARRDISRQIQYGFRKFGPPHLSQLPFAFVTLLALSRDSASKIRIYSGRTCVGTTIREYRRPQTDYLFDRSVYSSWYRLFNFPDIDFVASEFSATAVSDACHTFRAVAYPRQRETRRSFDRQTESNRTDRFAVVNYETTNVVKLSAGERETQVADIVETCARQKKVSLKDRSDRTFLPGERRKRRRIIVLGGGA